MSWLSRDPLPCYGPNVEYLQYSPETRSLYVQHHKGAYYLFDINYPLFKLLLISPDYPSGRALFTKESLLRLLHKSYKHERVERRIPC